jgi:hypothetical protein
MPDMAHKHSAMRTGSVMIFFAAIFSFLSGNAYAQDSMQKYDCLDDICLNDNSEEAEDKPTKIGGDDYLRKVEVCDNKVVSVTVYATLNSPHSVTSRADELSEKLLALGWVHLSGPEITQSGSITNMYAKQDIYGYRSLNGRVALSQNGSLNFEIAITSIHPEYSELCKSIDLKGL